MPQVGSNRYSVQGDRNIVTATFTALADADTWDTGLVNIESFSAMEIGTQAAADTITAASISGGIITWDSAGTITSALVMAQGT